MQRLTIVVFLFCIASIGRAAEPTTKPEAVLEVSPSGMSLQAAIDQARAMRRGIKAVHAPIIINVANSTYFLDRPIVLTPDDSGSSDAPLVIQAADGATPVFSGGRAISNWSEGELNGQKCWAVDVPETRDGKWPFHALWVNGKRAIRARFPNTGYLAVEASPDSTPNWEVGQTRFQFNPGAIKSAEMSPGAEVILTTRWVESRLPIAAIDLEHRIITSSKKSQWRIERDDAFWLEGSAAWFDAPGEWFLDQQGGKLYYLPREGEEMANAIVIAPVLEQLVRFEGHPEVKRYIDNIELRGLTFANSEYRLPDAPPDAKEPISGGYAQSDLNVVAAIHADGIRRCTFDHLTIRNVNNYAIHLERGCQNNTISHCTMTDLGAGGVRIGEGADKPEPERTFANTVSDCTITDGGNGFASAVGVWIGRSYDNLITHNEIADFYYSGLSIGWSWGYGDQLAHGNIIEYNHVHHIGKRSNGDGPILSDMGGIYTLGVQPGTTIRSNIFHDISAVKYGGWGIYLDEGSTGEIVENNLVYRTKHGSFHEHYGKDDIVRGNVFAFGEEKQLQHSRQEDHNGFTFENNVVVWDNKSPLLAPGASNATFRNNRYIGIAPADFVSNNAPWEQWKKSDPGSEIIADPFVNTKAGDFRLKPTTQPAGFSISIPTPQEVGPRK